MALILVIDDYPDTVDLLREILVPAGYQVAAASDGREALLLLRATNPDLVITDLYMPNQDGLETIIQLRRADPRLPIIAISGGLAANSLLAAAQKIGAVSALPKPFLTEELLAAVANALRSVAASP